MMVWKISILCHTSRYSGRKRANLVEGVQHLFHGRVSHHSERFAKGSPSMQLPLRQTDQVARFDVLQAVKEVTIEDDECFGVTQGGLMTAIKKLTR